MDTMSKSEFVRLHGDDLYNRFVSPLVDSEGEGDVWTTALVHGKMIRDTLLKYPGIYVYGSPITRVSFMIFQKNFIKKFGKRKWKKEFEKLNVRFERWLKKQKKLKNDE